MKGKLLIVEDDPMVAQDLQYEVERLGYEVVGTSESAEEAMAVAEIYLPDLALMDINIVGEMDGIQAARLLLGTYQIPAVFLTSHNDEATIRRAALEMPYGYLLKPPAREDLKAALLVAFLRAEGEAAQRVEQQQIVASMSTMADGILTVSLDGKIQFMNAAAERLTGMLPVQVRGRQLGEVIKLRDDLENTQPCFSTLENGSGVEEMGWALKGSNRSQLLVNVSIAPMLSNAGEHTGYVLTLRDAAKRLRERTIVVTEGADPGFETATFGMVQLDEEGRVVRVNDALARELGVDASRLLGRSLTDLSMDSDPRISKTLVPKLMGLCNAIAYS
jgi:PAS domain S-box-containing protein